MHRYGSLIKLNPSAGNKMLHTGITSFKARTQLQVDLENAHTNKPAACCEKYFPCTPPPPFVLNSWKFVYSVFCGVRVLFFELSRSNKHLTLLLSTSLTHNTDFLTSTYYFYVLFILWQVPQKQDTGKDTTPQKTTYTKFQLISTNFCEVPIDFDVLQKRGKQRCPEKIPHRHNSPLLNSM